MVKGLNETITVKNQTSINEEWELELTTVALKDYILEGSPIDSKMTAILKRPLSGTADV